MVKYDYNHNGGKTMELKGSKTEANLWTAFSGESQARNKYTYYASKAKKDGYEQIAKIFEDTAEQRKRARETLVQTAEKRHRFHGGEFRGRGCGRKLRMDGDVRRIRQSRR